MKRTFVKVVEAELAPIEPCLRAWCDLVERYCEQVADDVPWWYNERATLSTFAGAVARAGGLMLEEFRNPKRRKGESWRGRADLWFRPLAAPTGFVVEAKQGWFTMPTWEPAELVDYCKEKLAKAVADVKSDKSYGDTRLGFAFVVPEIGSDEDVPGLAAELQRVAKEEVEVDALAWVFPETGELHRHKGRVFPGVFLFVSVA